MRIRGGVLDAALAFGMLLIFAFAISWIMAWVGLLVPSPEVVQQASFIVVFPLTFIANTFAPIEGFPAPLKFFAEWNPVSTVTQAARELFGNANPLQVAQPETSWALEHPITYTLVWSAVILAIFMPLASAQYQRASSR